jgi:hypothetical protein
VVSFLVVCVVVVHKWLLDMQGRGIYKSCGWCSGLCFPIKGSVRLRGFCSVAQQGSARSEAAGKEGGEGVCMRVGRCSYSQGCSGVLELQAERVEERLALGVVKQLVTGAQCLLDYQFLHVSFPMVVG